MADVSHKITELENEIKVIKNEVKAILLDIREQYLNAENPFYARLQQGSGSTPVINISNTTAAPESHDHPGPKSDFSDLTQDDIVASPPEAINRTTGADETSKSSSPHHEKNGKEGTLPSLTLEPDQDDDSQKQEKQGKKNRPSSYSDIEPPVNRKGAELLQEINEYGIQELLNDDDRPVTRHKTGRGYNHRINLITIAGLSRWVDESVEKIGKERTEVMVEACHMVGHMPAELKDLVIRLVRLSQMDEPKKGKINTRDYLGVIAQLDNLLGYNSESESALLSILTNAKETNSG
jgi:hypothetical protein